MLKVGKLITLLLVLLALTTGCNSGTPLAVELEELLIEEMMETYHAEVFYAECHLPIEVEEDGGKTLYFCSFNIPALALEGSESLQDSAYTVVSGQRIERALEAVKSSMCPTMEYSWGTSVREYTRNVDTIVGPGTRVVGMTFYDLRMNLRTSHGNPEHLATEMWKELVDQLLDPQEEVDNLGC